MMPAPLPKRVQRHPLRCLLALLLFAWVTLSFAEETPPMQSPLAEFLASFSAEDRQAISNLIGEYRQAKLVTPAVDESRLTLGKSNAPVHLIDWIDIQCPHCKHFIEAMDGILQSIPPNQLSIESRHYPLDAECNPAMPPERRTGVSCLAAKALICLSDKPNFDAQRHELFKQQKFLTKELIWSTLTSDAKTRESLQTCIDAPETQAKLTADLKLADAHAIEGTPLVVINGRKTSAAPPIVYALILAQGDANAAEFATLPPPQKIVREEGGETPHQ